MPFILHDSYLCNCYAYLNILAWFQFFIFLQFLTLLTIFISFIDSFNNFRHPYCDDIDVPYICTHCYCARCRRLHNLLCVAASTQNDISNFTYSLCTYRNCLAYRNRLNLFLNAKLDHSVLSARNCDERTERWIWKKFGTPYHVCVSSASALIWLPSTSHVRHDAAYQRTYVRNLCHPSSLIWLPLTAHVRHDVAQLPLTSENSGIRRSRDVASFAHTSHVHTSSY